MAVCRENNAAAFPIFFSEMLRLFYYSRFSGRAHMLQYVEIFTVFIAIMAVL
jgi:hypothetical protein